MPMPTDAPPHMTAEACFEGMTLHLASALLWLLSALAASAGVPGLAVTVLLFGAFIVYPLAAVHLARKRRSRTDRPVAQPFLTLRTASGLALAMLLVGVVTARHLPWFYPSMTLLLSGFYVLFAVHSHMHHRRLVGHGLLLWLPAALLLMFSTFAAWAWGTVLVLLWLAVAGYSAGRAERRDERGETEAEELARLDAAGARMPFRILAGVLVAAFAYPLVDILWQLLHGRWRVLGQAGVVPICVLGLVMFWNIMRHGHLSAGVRRRIVGAPEADRPGADGPSRKD